MRARVIPPPLLVLACLIAGYLVQRRWPWPRTSLYSFGAGVAIGVVVFVCAFIFGGVAIATLVRARTPITPGNDPNHLVTRGPFRFTRNPAYVAFVTMLLAFAIAFCSLWLVLAAALLLVLLDRLVITREERIIASTFPDEYAAYCKRVRRWI